MAIMAAEIFPSNKQMECLHEKKNEPSKMGGTFQNLNCIVFIPKFCIKKIPQKKLISYLKNETDQLRSVLYAGLYRSTKKERFKLSQCNPNDLLLFRAFFTVY